MNNLLEQTKELCRLYDIKPARSKGQNFLIREDVYDELAAAAELKPGDTVLEVGPGLGFLTAKLAAKVKRVAAVELDDKLAAALQAGLMAKNIKNVEVVNEDILKFSIFNFQFSNNFKIQNLKFKIVANLPYNITSIFLRKFLSEAENKPELMVLLLQKEVAERVCAEAGGMSLLSVAGQFYAAPEIIKIVEKENFWPEPEVDSAIIKLETRKKRPEMNEKEFFRLVKFGFSARRKMLKNNLAAGFRISQEEAADKIKQAGLSEKIRAQELSVGDWLKLFSGFQA